MKIGDIHARLYFIGQRIEAVSKSPSVCMDEGRVVMEDAAWMLRLCNALLDKLHPNTRRPYYEVEPEHDMNLSEPVDPSCGK